MSRFEGREIEGHLWCNSQLRHLRFGVGWRLPTSLKRDQGVIPRNRDLPVDAIAGI